MNPKDFATENERWTYFILDNEEAFGAIVKHMSRARRVRLCYLSSDRRHVVLREVIDPKAGRP